MISYERDFSLTSINLKHHIFNLLQNRNNFRNLLPVNASVEEM